MIRINHIIQGSWLHRFLEKPVGRNNAHYSQYHCEYGPTFFPGDHLVEDTDFKKRERAIDGTLIGVYHEIR